MNTNHSPQINLFFPTPILFLKNDDYANKLLPYVKTLLSNEKMIGNVLNYKSTYNHKNNLESLEEMQEFVEYICEIGKNFLLSLGYNFTKKMSAMVFASEMRNGDYHFAHTHPNCILSGVFYLQIPKKSAKIIFNDPRDFRKFRSIEPLNNSNLNNNLNNSSIEIIPENGLFLMWESWLEHEVEINYSNDGRIALVFNIEQV